MLDTLSYKCQYNTASILRSSKQNHRLMHLILVLKRCFTEGISLIFITFHAKGLLFSSLIQPFFQNCLSCSICRWNNVNESIRSGMAVLDVTIPTGYWIQQQKLDSYVISKRVRNLQRAKFNDKKVLFYFDYVSIDLT